MISFLDKTFCASPDCINACGRAMTQHEKNILSAKIVSAVAFHGDKAIIPVSWGYFCGEPNDEQRKL